jgi:squalene-hopene/tetraprenyl-beta-curcumene cyclase
MRHRLAVAFAALTGSGVLIAGVASAHSLVRQSWDPRAAAAYLDDRQTWWESWSKARRDRGTVCLSCHTAMPYALARPELRTALGDADVASPERKLIDDVVTRVRAWGQVGPYYGGTGQGPDARAKVIESRGTEAVLNALVLATRDERTGTVSSDARQALANMLALQLTAGDAAGSWSWLDFHYQPWESSTSTYFGAALAAIAIGREPQGYAESRDVRANVEHLRNYLRTHVDQPRWDRLMRRDDPSLLNRAMLLWASARMPDLLSGDERREVTAALCDAQRDDGGWSLASLGRWHRQDGSAVDAASDGYATGLIAYALEEAGTAKTEPHLARALTWLVQHQDEATGMWTATSLNKQRDEQSDVGKFMSDAATAYAVLALTRAQR